jgi:hypothetical protein
MDTGTECPPESDLTYETFGAEFFGAYCNRCHGGDVTGIDRMGAPAPITFDDLPSIRERLTDIDQQAAAGPDAENAIMPPRPPAPPLAERYRLGEWLACGAP